MQITCQDAVDGHSVTRTLAYALLDSIMRRDGDKKWLTFMREKGYLKQVISSLLLEDGVLVESLQGNGNLASVYVHESRMSLLSTLARHRVGARALVETGIIQQLSDAKFLDMRPVVSNMGDGQGNEEKIHRYRMLLFPVLRLIMCLQSTLGIVSLAFFYLHVFRRWKRQHPATCVLLCVQTLRRAHQCDLRLQQP